MYRGYSMKNQKRPGKRVVIPIAAALVIIGLAAVLLVTGVFRGKPADRFECENAKVYKENGTTRTKNDRQDDPNASGGAVAGHTGGKYYRFKNVSQGNCVRIAYASPGEGYIDVFVRQPSEKSFTNVGQIPFASTGSWTMDGASPEVYGGVRISGGADLMIRPSRDCNLDCLWVTAEEVAPAEEASSFVYYDENDPATQLSASDDGAAGVKIQETEAYGQAEEKARQLLGQMTLTEKIGQLSQFGTSIYTSDDAYDGSAAEGRVGSFLTIRGAENTNQIQKDLLGATRLKIPALFADDVIHGYRTVFPTPLAQSCSWNTDAVRQSCAVSAKEAYAAGTRWTFGPMVDIARDPRWGRIMEGYGEDTYLCSRFAAAAVRGYQGDEAVPGKYQIFACLKHYVAYGAAIGGRDYNAADMSLQTMFDVYMPPFQAGINAGAASVMPAFESLNGVPVSASRYLLTDVLRTRFGFGGLTVSDYNAVQELVDHGVADTGTEAAELGFNAGIDILMAGDLYNDELPKLIEAGKVSETDVDEAVVRILTLKYLCGLMDEPYAEVAEEEALLGCREHRETARRVAAECAVLLENNGVLPLQDQGAIALTGPYAAGKGASELLGNWAFMGRHEDTVTVETGFRNAFHSAKIDVIDGCGFDGEGDDLDAAVKRAAKYDVIVACVGEQGDRAGEASSYSDLSLPGNQEEYVRRLCDTGKPVVLVVCAGRPLIMTDLKDRVSALLYAWQLGTESGSAIADLLLGNVNPSGRLTVSFPVSEGQLPVYYNHTSTGRPADDNDRFTSKYRDVQIEPLYPFGYGKSYTDFAFSDISLSSFRMKTDGKLTVSLTVTNTGELDGATVVQLYTHDLVASRARPVKELKGFQKVWLKAGESKRVSVPLEAASLAFADEETNMVVEPGDFMLWVAEDSADDRYGFVFTVEP